MKNLGRLETLYPLLPRCVECHHYIPSPHALPGVHRSHWPWCSKADPQVRAAYEASIKGEGVRQLRTARRVGWES